VGRKNTYKALPGGPGRNLFRWKGAGREIIKTQTHDRQTYHCSNIVYISIEPSKTIATPNGSVVVDLIKLTFHCQKGGPKPDLHPRPPDLQQNVRNFIADTPGKLLAPEGGF